VNADHGPHLVRYGGQDLEVIAATLGANHAQMFAWCEQVAWRRLRVRNDYLKGPRRGGPRGRPLRYTRPPDLVRPTAGRTTKW
jgi:hypothetical protein